VLARASQGLNLRQLRDVVLRAGETSIRRVEQGAGSQRQYGDVMEVVSHRAGSTTSRRDHQRYFAQVLDASSVATRGSCRWAFLMGHLAPARRRSSGLARGEPLRE
jgi:hypothetical protein